MEDENLFIFENFIKIVSSCNNKEEVYDVLEKMSEVKLND